MRCFVHREVEAVGTCRACNKGLCPDCAVDLGHSISCKGQCEAKANTINATLAQNITTIQTQKRNRFIGPVFFLFMGIAFILYAGDGTATLNFGTVLGGGFIAFGIALAIINQRYAKEIQKRA